MPRKQRIEISRVDISIQAIVKGIYVVHHITKHVLVVNWYHTLVAANRVLLLILHAIFIRRLVTSQE